MTSSHAQGRDRCNWRLSLGWCCVLAGGLTIVLIDNSPAATKVPTKTDAANADAERLVVSGIQAEISGNNSAAFALLHEAVRLDPENHLAHWQLGEVQIDNKWVTAEEAQRRSAGDPLQAEYRERRKASGQNLQGQLLLARWCRKHNLDEEAQFHWANVLSVDPKNEEALHALDMRWQKRRLVFRGQTAQETEQLKGRKRAADHWGSRIVKWRRSVSGRDLAAQDAALTEIRAIAEADAIPSMEEVTLGRDARDDRHAEACRQIGLAFLDALAKMPAQEATESLARHAVFAPGDKVRVSAIEKLKPRDLHDYVPMLLGGLGMPIESTFNVMTGPDGSVHYLHSLFREGPESDWAADVRHAAVQRDFGGRHTNVDLYTGNVTDLGPPEAPIITASRKSAVASTYQSRFANDASATESKVANANQAIETLNNRIMPVLAGTTGQAFGDNPKMWWDWWRKQNEYYASGDHPVDRYYYSDCANYYYGFSTYSNTYSGPPPIPSGPLSCFAQGTPVWTKTGMRPIESLDFGDLVLSQDVDTGELKYEPVIGRTVRPPSPIVKLSVGNEPIVATRGHLFWIAGVGWRMAKEITRGDMLHGVGGSSVVRSVDAAGQAEAYNLIVANFSTYFVGENGLLVHDNTPRSPTQAIVPGLIAKK